MLRQIVIGALLLAGVSGLAWAWSDIDVNEEWVTGSKIKSAATVYLGEDALNGGHRFLLVWNDNRDVMSRLFTQGQDGIGFWSGEELRFETPVKEAKDMSVVVADSGMVMAVWEDDKRIYSALYDVEDGWSVPVRIDTGSEPKKPTAIRLASGDILAGWHDEKTSPKALVTRVYSVAESSWASPQTLAVNDPKGLAMVQHPDSVEGVVVIFRDNNDTKATRWLDGAWSEDAPITLPVGNKSKEHTLAVIGSEVVVVYSVDDKAVGSISLQDDQWGEETLLEPSARKAKRPLIVSGVDGQGELTAMVNWYDEDERGVFARRWAAGGWLPVEQFGSGNKPKFGALAMDAVGNAVAFWSDDEKNLVLDYDWPRVSVVRGDGYDGTITSEPAGITCGGVCNYQFSYGESVVLTATGEGIIWEGACAGEESAQCELVIHALTEVSVRVEGEPDTQPPGDDPGPGKEDSPGKEDGPEEAEDSDSGKTGSMGLWMLSIMSLLMVSGVRRRRFRGKAA